MKRTSVAPWACVPILLALAGCHRHDSDACWPLADVSDLVGAGELFFGYAVLGTSALTVGCGDLGEANEISVEWKSTFDGDLVVSTQHPSTRVDTVLEVREGRCDGEPIDCGAEAIPGAWGSRLTIPVQKGDRYVAVVETADDEEGVFALGLHPVGVCEGEGAAEDVTGALLTGQRFASDTAASTSSQRGSCGGDADAPEARYRFTALEDGEMAATTVHPDTEFASVLHVREAALGDADYCDSVEAEVACDVDGAPGGAGPLARFAVQAGREYEVFVDGADEGEQGEATLTIGTAVQAPVTEVLEGCDHASIRDQYAFFAQDGQSVHVRVDTVDAATAADTRLRVRLPDGTSLYEADDDVACTFPPPQYSCPEHSFTASESGLYTVEVYVGSSEVCANPNRANYEIAIDVDGESSEAILIRDE